MKPPPGPEGDRAIRSTVATARPLSSWPSRDYIFRKKFSCLSDWYLFGLLACPHPHSCWTWHLHLSLPVALPHFLPACRDQLLVGSGQWAGGVMWEVGRVRFGVCSQLLIWAASAPLKMSGGWSSPPLAPRPVVPGRSNPLSALTPLSPAPCPRWFPVHHPQLHSPQCTQPRGAICFPLKPWQYTQGTDSPLIEDTH